MSDADKYNTDLANRQVQINNWSYNNKMETLFIFQLTFVSLLIVSILMLLKVEGFLTSVVVWYVMLIMVVLLVLIIVNRAIYNNSVRDGRYWNKRNFADDQSLASPLTAGDTSYFDYIDSLRKASGESTC